MICVCVSGDQTYYLICCMMLVSLLLLPPWCRYGGKPRRYTTQQCKQ